MVWLAGERVAQGDHTMLVQAPDYEFTHQLATVLIGLAIIATIAPFGLAHDQLILVIHTKMVQAGHGENIELIVSIKIAHPIHVADAKCVH